MDNPYIKRKDDAANAIKAQYDLAVRFIESQQVLENVLTNIKLENEQKVLDAKKDSYQKQFEQIELNARKEDEALEEKIKAVEKANKKLRDANVSGINDKKIGLNNEVISGLQNQSNLNKGVNAREKENLFEQARKELLTETATVFRNISNILGALDIGADTFVGKMLSGFELTLNLIQKIVSTVEAVNTIGSILKLFSFSEGGYVSGAGTGTSDSIPARLSNGEFVVRAEAVNKQTYPLLEMLNGNKKSVGFGYANGGLVSGQPNRPIVNVIVQSEVEKTKAVKFLTNYTPLYNSREAGSSL